ncbi:hypothetical protein ACKI2N_031945 [Cupriavidus sp. 30B13]|uniref:hypothetical protein n=1 Tax=Cupriavidus sp. 30B13 TaxID=3384241 RepID=UPI003B9036EE
MQAENRVETLRQAMADAGVKDVPGYSESWSTGADGITRNVRDYGATTENLQRVYEDFVRDQRLRETWGDDYQSLRIGKSQMTPMEFEKKVLDIHQRATDAAYTQGVDLIAKGELEVKPGEYAKELGNFIDKQVRDGLRGFAKVEGLSDSAASNIWAVNRRLKSEIMPGWGIPDSRLGYNMYADTTLAMKGPYTEQIQKWNSLRPGYTIIIRPSALPGPIEGTRGSYVIPRPAIPSYVPRNLGRGL